MGVPASGLLRQVAFPLVLVMVGAFLVFRVRVVVPAESALEAARRHQVAGFATRLPLGAGVPTGWSLHLADAQVLALASPDGHRLLVGTAGGAFLYDPLTGARSPLPVPRDVPDSAVLALAALGGTPALGLASGGVALLGASGVRVAPADVGAARIRALAVAGGRVYVGGATGPLWWCDLAGGSGRGHPRHPDLELAPVRALAGRQDELLLGGGAGEARWIRGEGTQQAILAGEQVLQVALGRQLAWLGTEQGVHLWRPGRAPEVVSMRHSVTAMAAQEQRLHVGGLDGRVERFEVDAAGAVSQRQVARVDGPVRALLELGERLYLGGPAGLMVLEPGRTPEVLVAPEGLVDAHVAALAEDPDGDLWVGHFAAGLVRLDAQGRARERDARPDLLQVNRLLAPAPERAAYPGLLVATSRGLFHRSLGGGTTRLELGEGEARSPRYQGLVETPEGLAVAGADGVRLRGADGRVRALAAFHGLPSNRAYALASRGEDLFVGTLAGLARLRGGHLSRTWRPESSRLPSGWVQALAFGPAGLYAGTFGGGVALLPQGELELRPLPGSPRDVNPNAMLVHAGSLYVGSAGEGLWRYDAAGRLAGRVRRGLPSWDVQALAPGRRGLWVGTTRGVARIPWNWMEEGT